MSVAATASKTLSDNKKLATTAAIFETGRIANKKLGELAAKQLPAPANFLAGTPFGQVVLANIVKLAGEQFRPGDKTVERLTNGMIVAAYSELIQQFDIEGLIDSLLSERSIKAALKRADAAEE